MFVLISGDRLTRHTLASLDYAGLVLPVAERRFRGRHAGRRAGWDAVTHWLAAWRGLGMGVRVAGWRRILRSAVYGARRVTAVDLGGFPIQQKTLRVTRKGVGYEGWEMRWRQSSGGGSWPRQAGWRRGPVPPGVDALLSFAAGRGLEAARRLFVLIAGDRLTRHTLASLDYAGLVLPGAGRRFRGRHAGRRAGWDAVTHWLAAWRGLGMGVRGRILRSTV